MNFFVLLLNYGEDRIGTSREKSRMSSLYYRHSGKFSIHGVAMGLVAGLAAAVVLSFIYSYLILYIPFIYGNFLATCGFGALIGGVAAWGLRRGKVRSTSVALSVVAIVAIGALYAAWVVWMYAFLRRQETDLRLDLAVIALHPRLLFDLILAVSETGAWRILGVTPSGPVLWIVWLVEASLIMGIALFFAADKLSEPFCESCERWSDRQEGIATVADADAEELRKRLEAKDFAFLEALGAKKANAGSWVRLDLHSCPDCGMLNTLSVKQVILKVDKNGKESQGLKEVMNRLLLDVPEAARLRRLDEQLTRPAPPQPAITTGSS
jgi:hypothetical protein